MDASSIFHRVKRKIKTKQEFYFGPNKLETVDDYKYLGLSSMSTWINKYQVSHWQM